MSALATHVEEQLLDFAYGELSDREARAVETHLSSCAKCKAQLQEIQGVRKVMARLPETDAPADGLDSLLAYADQAARRVQAGPAPKKTWWRSVVYPLAGVAAAATFFVVVKPIYQGDYTLDKATRAAAVQTAAEESNTLSQPPPAAIAASPAPIVAEPEAAKELSAVAKRELGAHGKGAGAALDDAFTERGDLGGEHDRKMAQGPSPAKKKSVSGAKPAPDLMAEEERASIDGLSGAGVGGLGSLGSGPGGGGTGAGSRRDQDEVAKNVDAQHGRSAQKKKAEEKPADKAGADLEATVKQDAAPQPPPPPAPATATKDAADAKAQPKAEPRSPAVPMATGSVSGGARGGYGDEPSRTAARAPASAPAENAEDAYRTQSESVDTASAAEAPMAEAKAVRREQQAADDEQAKALLTRATAANKAGRREDALALGRQILALDVHAAWIRQGALSVMCDAQAALEDALTACQQLVAEYPSSGAARLARGKMGEYASKRAKKADQAAPTTSTPSAAPPAKARNAAESGAADSD